MSRFSILIFSIFPIFLAENVFTQTNPTITTVTPRVASAEIFYVSNGYLNQSCMVLELMATIVVSYKNVSEKSQIWTGYINSNLFEQKTIKVNGSCGKQVQEMLISWPALYIGGIDWILSFSVNNTIKNYKINNIKLQIPMNKTLNNSSQDYVDLISKWSVEIPMKNYYVCKNQATLDFTSTNTESTAKVTVHNVRFISFRQPDKDTFPGVMTQCVTDKIVSNIVPLVVGGVLAAMIVIVIITYLIGRRRHRGNYQSI